MRKTSKLGVWGSLGSPPYGAQTPDLTGPCYSPGGPDKNSFYSGGIGPNLGEIWNFEIFNITVFEPILAKSLQNRRHVDRCGRRAVSAYRPEVQRSSVCGAPPRLRTRRVLQNPTVASPAMEHWGMCPLDFQQCFQLIYRVAQSLTAILCGCLSKHIVFCNSSCGSSVGTT